MEAVLRDTQRLDRRVTGHRGWNRGQRRDRDVFKLVGDDVAVGRQARNGGRIVEGAGDDGRNLAAGRIRARVEEAEAERERVAGQRQHAPELAGSDDPDLHAPAGLRGSGVASTCSVWAAR